MALLTSKTPRMRERGRVEKRQTGQISNFKAEFNNDHRMIVPRQRDMKVLS